MIDKTFTKQGSLPFLLNKEETTPIEQCQEFDTVTYYRIKELKSEIARNFNFANASRNEKQRKMFSNKSSKANQELERLYAQYPELRGK